MDYSLNYSEKINKCLTKIFWMGFEPFTFQIEQTKKVMWLDFLLGFQTACLPKAIAKSPILHLEIKRLDCLCAIMYKKGSCISKLGLRTKEKSCMYSTNEKMHSS